VDRLDDRLVTIRKEGRRKLKEERMIHCNQREEEQKSNNEKFKRVKVESQQKIKQKENDCTKQIANQQVVHAEEIKSQEKAFFLVTFPTIRKHCRSFRRRKISILRSWKMEWLPLILVQPFSVFIV